MEVMAGCTAVPKVSGTVFQSSNLQTHLLKPMCNLATQMQPSNIVFKALCQLARNMYF